MNERPLILVTNDDGIFAPGIKNLIKAAQKHGEVIVVAPDSPQSAKGHAITLMEPLRVNRVNSFGDDVETYTCTGTPVDCVKLAKNVLLKDRQLALCISGINHGSNASINIIYSGTMSAAMEAAIEGIPSIGFSLLDFSFEADFGPTVHYADKIIGHVLQHGIMEGNLLNINIPKLPLSEIKGIKVCRQGGGTWKEDYRAAVDPRGNTYYWLTGEFNGEDDNKETDLWALKNGYISIVPSSHDLTNYPAIEANNDLSQL